MKLYKHEPLKRDFVTPCGDTVRETFQVKSNSDGTRELVKNGEILISDYVNSFRDECLIENIVRRYQNGDINALNRVQGAYIDQTILPKDLHQAHLLLENARGYYENCSEDIKDKYRTFSDFIAAFGSGEVVEDVVREIYSPFVEKIPEEVKEDENDG